MTILKRNENTFLVLDIIPDLRIISDTKVEIEIEKFLLRFGVHSYVEAGSLWEFSSGLI